MKDGISVGNVTFSEHPPTFAGTIYVSGVLTVHDPGIHANISLAGAHSRPPGLGTLTLTGTPIPRDTGCPNTDLEPTADWPFTWEDVDVLDKYSDEPRLMPDDADSDRVRALACLIASRLPKREP